MDTSAPAIDDVEEGRGANDHPAESELILEEELILHLERDQFVAETSAPVQRGSLGSAAAAWLWALRIFVVLVSAMVLYTFIAGLR
ncbi:MAG: hypothetical protein ACYCUM_04150 [Solirubrobacteraceae bacterium]